MLAEPKIVRRCVQAEPGRNDGLRNHRFASPGPQLPRTEGRAEVSRRRTPSPLREFLAHPPSADLGRRAPNIEPRPQNSRENPEIRHFRRAPVPLQIAAEKNRVLGAVLEDFCAIRAKIDAFPRLPWAPGCSENRHF